MLQDVRHALRTLRKSPGFAVVAVLVLAVGIGVNTAIFSLINAVLFRPPNVNAPAELRYVYPKNPRGYLVTYRDYQYVLTSNDVFADLAGVAADIARLGSGADVMMMRGERVTSNYFRLLGVGPTLGRVFSTDDDRNDRPRVAVISHSLWVRQFHSDPNILGKNLKLTRMGVLTADQWPDYAIVGVMPAGFKGISNPWEATQYWVPHVRRWDDYRDERRAQSPQGPPTLDRTVFGLLIGRLKPGASDDRVTVVLATFGDQIRQAHYPTVRDYGLVAQDARRVRLPFDPRGEVVPSRLAFGLLAVAGAVLLIALINLAGLLMARGIARRTEIAVRLTLGASRWRVTRRLLTEGVLLAVVGGGLGLLAGRALIVFFVNFTPTEFGQYSSVPFSLEVPVDWRVLGFTSLLCIGAGVIVGLAPARQAARTDLLTALAGGSNASSGRTQPRLRRLVVVPQICLSAALLLVAGVLIKPLVVSELVDPGYDSDGVAFVDFQIPFNARWDDVPAREALFDRNRRFNARVLEALAETPGVTTATLSMGLPIQSMKTWVAGRDTFPNGPRWWVSQAHVSSDYFKTLGISLIRGRRFEPADRDGTPLVAIICETLATWFWPGQSAVGQHVAVAFPDSTSAPRWLEVVGVVREVQPPVTTGASNPYLYVPLTQLHGEFASNVIARGTLDDGQMVRALRQAVFAADPGVEISRSTTFESAIDAILYPRRMAAGILSFAGVIGLALAAIGLYGVVSYSVAQRLREIGIRATLGARPRDLVRLILSEGVAVAAIGSVLGLGLGYGALVVASKIVPGMPELNAAALIAVPVVIVGVILAACYLPARRAGRVDPMVVLRGL